MVNSDVEDDPLVCGVWRMTVIIAGSLVVEVDVVVEAIVVEVVVLEVGRLPAPVCATAVEGTGRVPGPREP